MMKRILAIVMLISLMLSIIAPVAMANVPYSNRECTNCGEVQDVSARCGDYSRRTAAGSHQANATICNYYTLQLNLKWTCKKCGYNANQIYSYHNHVIIHQCEQGAINVCGI